MMSATPWAISTESSSATDNGTELAALYQGFKSQNFLKRRIPCCPPERPAITGKPQNRHARQTTRQAWGAGMATAMSIVSEANGRPELNRSRHVANNAAIVGIPSEQHRAEKGVSCMMIPLGPKPEASVRISTGSSSSIAARMSRNITEHEENVVQFQKSRTSLCCLDTAVITVVAAEGLHKTRPTTFPPMPKRPAKRFVHS